MERRSRIIPEDLPESPGHADERRFRSLAAAVIALAINDIEDHLRKERISRREKAFSRDVSDALSFLFGQERSRDRAFWLSILNLDDGSLWLLKKRTEWAALLIRLKQGCSGKPSAKIAPRPLPVRFNPPRTASQPAFSA